MNQKPYKSACQGTKIACPETKIACLGTKIFSGHQNRLSRDQHRLSRNPNRLSGLQNRLSGNQNRLSGHHACLTPNGLNQPGTGVQAKWVPLNPHRDLNESHMGPPEATKGPKSKPKCLSPTCLSENA